jgi:hypothetical protein
MDGHRPDAAASDYRGDVDDDVAELAALRRRAYGPDADIDGDPAALARLDELETRARRALAPVSPPVVEKPPQPVVAAAPAAATVVGQQVARPHGFRWRAAVVAGVVAVAVLVVAQAVVGPTVQPGAESSVEPTAAADPVVVRALDASETTLVDIPLDRSLARYVPQPAAPEIAVEGGLQWAESLGPYYGVTLWLARAADTGQRCIMLMDEGSRTYSRCASDDRFLGGLLDVAVPYGDVAPEDRPARMTSGQNLVFRWTAERGVSIVLDEADITYFGDND